MRETPRWLAPAACAAAVVALVAYSAWSRYQFLTVSPYPIGIDGWFYPVQLRSLLDTGSLRYPASPLGFWLLAPFAWATDPIVGAKLGASILGAMIAVPMYFVGKRLGGSRATGLLAAALATTSAGSFYLSVEFVKNGIGMTIVTTYVWMLLRALEQRTWTRIALAVLVFVASVLTHKVAAAAALIVTIPAVTVELKAWRITAIGAAGAVVVLAVLAIAFPGRFIGARELGLVEGLLTGTPNFAIPALQRGTRAIWMGHEAAIAGGLGVALVIGLLVRRRWFPKLDRPDVRPAALAVAITLAVLAIAIALPWIAVRDPQGVGFRLRLVAYVPMALIGAALAGAAAAPLREDRRIACVLAFAAAWIYAQPVERDEGVVRTHPVMAGAVMGLDRAVPDDAVIICPERHILFMAAYYTSNEVRLRPDGVPPERRWRLMPYAFVTRGGVYLDEALLAARAMPDLPPPRGLHARNTNGLVVVPEVTWQWVVRLVTAIFPEDSPTYRRVLDWKTI